MNDLKKLTEDIALKINKQEDYLKDLFKAVENKELIATGMEAIWSNLLIKDQEQILLDKDIFPNEKSQTIFNLIMHYNLSCSLSNYVKKPDEWGKKINNIILILEKTQEGKKSILKDIEKMFVMGGKNFVNDSAYEFIETIYQKYSKDKNKIYYLEALNLIKFCNTFSHMKPIFEVKIFNKDVVPRLEKLVDTPHFDKLVHIKFPGNDIEEKWINFCKNLKLKSILEDKLPETGKTIKKIKI